MIIRGNVWKYGDNVDTDVIIPARYLNRSTEKELAAHCMEDIDPLFASQVRPGDIVVAGQNFGCGSSREHAPLALKGCGVSCVIARSFARIFYRNAINSGLAILECPGAVDGTEANHTLAVDLRLGTITNETTGREYSASPFPEFIMRIVEAGGLIPFTRQRLKGQKGKQAGTSESSVVATGGQG